MQIIRNMGVLAECKDACDQHVSERGREEHVSRPIEGAIDDLYHNVVYLMDENHDAYGIFEHPAPNTNDQHKMDRMPDLLDFVVGIDCRKTLHACLRTPSNKITASEDDEVGFEMNITVADPT